jgi:hypothetical protein
VPNEGRKADQRQVKPAQDDEPNPN